MRRKIPCFCDNTFVVDIPEEIDLDKEPQLVEDILAGNFLNYTCSSCGKKHKPEFNLTVKWVSKNVILEVLPELSRGEFYRRKEDKTPDKKETVISYPELSERISMLKDELVIEAVEAIKYYLFVKADESYPEQDISVWYHTKNGDNLEFHIHGIKDNEVAVMRVPVAVYIKTLNDFTSNPNADPFPALRVRTYCSIQNMLQPEELRLI
jgi:hypothetical protein